MTDASGKFLFLYDYKSLQLLFVPLFENPVQLEQRLLFASQHGKSLKLPKQFTEKI